MRLSLKQQQNTEFPMNSKEVILQEEKIRVGSR